MITLIKPPLMPKEALSHGMPFVEEELQTIRRILEQQECGAKAVVFSDSSPASSFLSFKHRH
jgi:hypothetical protein